MGEEKENRERESAKNQQIKDQSVAAAGKMDGSEFRQSFLPSSGEWKERAGVCFAETGSTEVGSYYGRYLRRS